MLIAEKNIYAYKNKFSYKCDHIFIMYKYIWNVYKKKKGIYNLPFSFDRGLNYDPGVVWWKRSPCMWQEETTGTFISFCENFVSF